MLQVLNALSSRKVFCLDLKAKMVPVYFIKYLFGAILVR